MARLASASPAPGGPSASAPGGATAPRRSTRSQSREPQAVTQLPTRNTRASSRQPEDARQDAAEGLSSMALAQGALDIGRGLQPVAEEVEQPQTTIAPLNDEPSGRPSQHGRFSVGAASMYSTTFSQEEVENLDLDAVLGSLPDLDSMADAILATAAPPDASLEDLMQQVQRLNDENSAARKYLLGRVRTFSRMQGDFGKQTFINPEHVLRALLDLAPGSVLENAAWRPDDVLYKANLVSFLQIIFESRTTDKIIQTMTTMDSQGINDLLASLKSESNFMGLLGESQLVDATCSLALEIRIQLFIHTIMQGFYDEPLEKTLARIFLYDLDNGEPGFPDEISISDIRTWDNAVDAGNSQDFYESVVKHVNGLRMLIASCHDDLDLALSTLREENSWDAFCGRALSWVQMRHQELNRMIDERGGTESIAEQLRREVESVQNQNDPALDPAIGGTGGPRSSGATRNGIAALKQRMRRAVQQPTPPSQPAPAQAQQSQSEPNQPQVIVDDGEEMHPQFIADLRNYNAGGADVFPVDNDPPQAVNGRGGSGIDLARRERLISDAQQNRAGQENRRFVDRQPNATRPTWTDTQQSQAQQNTSPQNSYPATYPVVSPARSRRTYDEMDSPEVSQDQSFQTDPRVHGAPQRAPAANMTASSAAGNRDTRPRTAGMTDASQGRVPELQRTNPGQAIPPYNPNGTHLSGAGFLEHATQVARQNAPMRATPRQPRPRTGWSNDENQALMDLMAIYGCAWSEIKKADQSGSNTLSLRTAEDIRFKARNIKLTVLQGPGPDAMPPGFEDVPLGKKEIEKLPEHIRATYVQVRQRQSRRFGDIE
ncbi:hypothetical protein BDZ85DRAFT_51537 [Elsinoe ampelina]|uniref:Myb-like domain-containing protein n=1 Tax=Elsinoe ampelina TaxID=302913 RepID=A0A6A6GLG4_9PEZI|nr:hypothetical protein BDZ85DRAFT_51537 [Elsinoe ampelina]